MLSWVEHEKFYNLGASLQGFWQSETQTGLLSWGDSLENWNLAYGKFRYDTFQKVNNKDAE